MSNVQNWATGAVTGTLILLAPMIAFVMIVTMEVLIDVGTQVGSTIIWLVVAGAMAWVLLRKFGVSSMRLDGDRNVPDQTSRIVPGA